MKRVHIVQPYRSQAMNRMSQPLLDELPALYEVTIGEAPDPAADLNIHIPWHTLINYEGGGKHIIAYTHCNPGAQAALVDACHRADIVTAMSFTGRRELLNAGVDPAKIWVVYCAADTFNLRKRTVLICGRSQPNGRKRESLLFDLAYQYDLTLYEFIFTGLDWLDTVEKLKLCGVSAQAVQLDTEAQLNELYQRCDVLLVTGYTEGGPLPILEGMAAGIPILSPRFGYASDLLDEESLYDTPADLMEKLDAMNESRVLNHQVAKSWNWKDYAAEYALLAGRLLGESVDLYPERGISRYTQLPDVIDEIKPKSIVEIGTWNGTRAVQMLQQAGKYYPMKQLSYQGFDLFSLQTGEQFTRELSKYAVPEKIARKRIEATGAHVKLIAGDTIETINKMAPAELYFVDGGHSEATIQNDGERVTRFINDHGGVAVFDDYYHEKKPPGMGCNKFIAALDRNLFLVTHLPARTRDPEDGRLIGMVRVERANISVSMSTETFAFTGASHARV